MEEQVYSNLFYFKYICKIGGTEQFLWEIAKKYHKYDITIVCDRGDEKQVERLRKLVRVIIRKPEQRFKCKKAFLNFNDELIPFLDAEEIIFVSHAIFQEIGYKPPIHHKEFTGYMAVSNYAAEKLNEYSKIILDKEIHTDVSYNPLTLEPKEKVPILVAASRLDDKTKGGARTVEFIKAMDAYCEKHNRHYLFLIFTNATNFELPSMNCVYMKPRPDVRPYIAMADFIVNLSNNMETYCYTINEGLGYGVPVVTTPLTVLNEFEVDDNMLLKCDWDMSNVDEIVRRIFEDEVKPFTYNIPKDSWDKFLVHVDSNYEEERKMKVKVKCIKEYYDLDIKTLIKPVETDPNYERIISKERADVLVDKNLVEIVEVIKEEIKKEKAVKTNKKIEKNIR